MFCFENVKSLKFRRQLASEPSLNCSLAAVPQRSAVGPTAHSVPTYLGQISPSYADLKAL